MLRYLIKIFFLQLLCLTSSLESIVKQGLTNSVNVKPGEEVPVNIQLTNSCDQAQSYTLSMFDYTYQANGDISYLKPGQLPRSNASWIHLYTRSVTIPPTGEANVFYDIKVPQDPSLSGSYWSIMLIEPQDQQNDQSYNQGGVNLIVRVRYAYQIVTTILDGVSKLQLQDHQISHIDSKRLLSVDVKNTGTLFLNPMAYLKLYNSQGTLVHTLEGKTQKILPTCSVRYYFDIQDIEPGSYSALIFFDDKQKAFCYRLKVLI